MVISFDTMVLIWGVKQVATPGQEHRIEEARRFLALARERNFNVVLSTVAVSEYLCGFEPSEHAAQIDALRHFAVVPFDLRAASIAAQLTRNRTLVDELRSEYEVSRQTVKADMAILACAISAGAQTFYTTDQRLRKAAQGRIIVKELAEIASGQQKPMF